MKLISLANHDISFDGSFFPEAVYSLTPHARQGHFVFYGHFCFPLAPQIQ